MVETICKCGHARTSHEKKGRHRCCDLSCGCAHFEPAAAPTPVEPRCQYCGKPRSEHLGDGACNEGGACYWMPAAPAESQGVERAQPVEGPREPLWLIEASEGSPFTTPESNVRLEIHGLLCCCNYPEACRSEGIAETLASIDLTKGEWSESYEDGWIKAKRPPAPVEGVERVTDDRPAETISETAMTIPQAYELGKGQFEGPAAYWQKKFRCAESDRVPAEDRIAELERALRALVDWHDAQERIPYIVLVRHLDMARALLEAR